MYLVTTSASLGQRSRLVDPVQLKGLQGENRREVGARHFAAFVVPTMDEAIEVAKTRLP